MDPTAGTSLEYVYKWNEEAVAQQNDRFNALMEKYVEEEEEEEEAPEEVAGETKAPEVDPLTAMVMEQEAIKLVDALYSERRVDMINAKQ